MGSEWKKQYLGDIVDNFDALRIPVTNNQRKRGPYPYYGASGVIDYIDSFIFDGLYLLISEDGENLKTRKQPITYLADGKFWVNNHAHIIKGKIGLSDTKFLLYALEAINISGYLTGSTQPKLTQKNLNKIELLIPCYLEQKSIAHILGTLDDKIELNRQMNETLEAIAQALFQSWFVDFDPVIDKALASGKPIPEPLQERAAIRQALGNQRKPLPEDIAQLFPDEFVESELGWIPKGWPLTSLSKIAVLNPSETIKRNYLASFVDMKALPTQGSGIITITKKIYQSGSKFKNDDALLARITPCLENGKTALVDGLDPGEVGHGSTEFIVLRGENPKCPSFLYLLCRFQPFREYCKKNMTGSSGRQRIAAPIVGNFSLPLPVQKEKLLSYFEHINCEFFRKISKNNYDKFNLTQLRDTLLPKLISGEICIPDAEKLLGKVT